MSDLKLWNFFRPNLPDTEYNNLIASLHILQALKSNEKKKENQSGF